MRGARAQRRRHDDRQGIVGDFEFEASEPARVLFFEERGDERRRALLDPHQREPAGVAAKSLARRHRRRVRPIGGVECLQVGYVAGIECGKPRGEDTSSQA